MLSFSLNICTTKFLSYLKVVVYFIYLFFFFLGLSIFGFVNFCYSLKFEFQVFDQLVQYIYLILSCYMDKSYTYFVKTCQAFSSKLVFSLVLTFGPFTVLYISFFCF